MTLTSSASRVDNIRHSLVGLKMPRALEMLDATLRRIERGEIDGIEAIDDLLTEELSLRENRRMKAALRMARLPILKTLAGFDFRSSHRVLHISATTAAAPQPNKATISVLDDYMTIRRDAEQLGAP